MRGRDWGFWVDDWGVLGAKICGVKNDVAETERQRTLPSLAKLHIVRRLLLRLIGQSGIDATTDTLQITFAVYGREARGRDMAATQGALI